MGRQRQYDTPEAILRRIREGRGTGEGAAYKPWFETKDISSRGRRHRLFSAKFCRTIHLLSDLERSAFFLAEFLPFVIGLKEQLPLLPQAETLCDAQSLGIRHPTIPQTRYPAVMSTDQIWFIQDAGTTVEWAINAKYVDERLTPRNQEKRSLEKLYHVRRSRKFLDFDELVVSDDFVANWGFVRSLLRPDYADARRAALSASIDQEFRSFVSENQPRQEELVAKVARKFAITPADAIPALHSLIATRSWPVDITTGRLGPGFAYRFQSS